MATKLYGKDLREYDNIDVETLLTKLSYDELVDLNNDFDPDNSLLPPSQRSGSQTTKEPTGPFQRDKLLKFLKDKAQNEKDWDETVPYKSGQKRGKVWCQKEPEFSVESVDDMNISIHLDIEDDLQALGGAPENDLVDLAGILGMHSLLSQAQYYNALKGIPQDETTGMSFSGVIRPFCPKILPDESPNNTNVNECIQRLTQNDPGLIDVNLNNMKGLSKERIKMLIKTAKDSSHLETLSLANTGISDAQARELVDLLETSPSLRVLNVESNFLSPELLAKLLRATLKQQSLIEFHADNQRASVLGNQVEMDMMMSLEENESLLRVGVCFQSMEARNRVSEALERNYERRQSQEIPKNSLVSSISHNP